MKINLIILDSYFDLDFEQRAKVVVAVSKPKNFFDSFFNNLPNARTRIECFNKINDLHFEIYGYEMYSSYRSFSQMYKRYVNQSK